MPVGSPQRPGRPVAKTMRSNQSLFPALFPALAALVAFLIQASASADRLPTFEQIQASDDTPTLTAWANRYARGVGVARDPAKAVELFCKAARRGDADAKFQLGQSYAFGQGVERDRELAVAWYYAAAAGKSRNAQAMLEVLKVTQRPARTPTCPGDRQEQGPRTVRVRPTSGPASEEIAGLVRDLAPQYRLDPNLVLAVIEAESGFDPKALSPKNAQGLMQLIPETASRFGVEDVWDPEQNLHGGMAYLRWLLDRFDGDVELALAGYNAGPKAVERHGGIPPYTETQTYVARIIRRIGGQG